MADVTSNQQIKNILKRYYKDSIESVLTRNSPVLKEIPIVRIEGESYNFAVLYGRGGAVSANARGASTYALQHSTSKNTVFSVTPGFLFSDYTTDYLQKEASKSQRGAYMKAEANQFFAALEAFRKTLAKCLYGTGYGEFGVAGSAVSVAATGNTLTLSGSALIGVDIGTQFKRVNGADPSTAPDAAVYTVTAIDEDANTITFDADTAGGSIAVGDVLVLTDGRDSAGGPRYPVGLEAWLPTGTNRSTAKLQQSFFGNTSRYTAPNRLAGQYVAGGTITSSNKLSYILSELFRKVRRYGGEPDMIVLNDEARAYLQAELGNEQTYWQSVAEKRLKPSATVGFEEIAFAFATSWLDKVIDDPYCPLDFAASGGGAKVGKAYILSLKNGSRPNIEFVAFTKGTEATRNDVAGNQPGKPDPNAEGEDPSDSPFKLNIDDLVTVTDGGKGDNGSQALVELRFAGNLCVYAPASCGVATFTLTSALPSET